MIQPRVSIIILNWNNYSVTKDCLISLGKIIYPNYEIILVDNGSTDGSVDKFEKEFSDIKLIKNKENLGFAAGNNVGIKYALKKGADYILLLNNDTEVASDFLDKMTKIAEQSKKIGIVGAKIYYFDEPEKIWFAGGDFIKWRASVKHRHWREQDSPKLTGVKQCDFITGCAMLIKTQVFDDIGLLYEPYFLGTEDSDFCLHAKDTGWGIRVNLDAHILHKVSTSRLGEFSFSNTYYGARNRLFYAFKRTHNILGGIIFLCVVIPIRIVQWIIMGRFDMVKGTILGSLDFFKGKMDQRK